MPLMHLRVKFVRIGCLIRVSILVSAVGNYVEFSLAVVWHDACPDHSTIHVLE